MPGHTPTPQEVAAAIRSSSDAEVIARELLEQYGAQAPLVWDVGVNEFLVMRPGWNAARAVKDYLWISPKA